MLNVKFEGEYDAERNIVFLKYINKPVTFEDVDFWASESERLWRMGEQNKVWGITDISQMGMASPKLVSYYHKKLSEIVDKYLIDFCVICDKALERIAAQLFNILMREKHPIFRTMDEAVDWTIKEQEARGRFIPLE